jgi:hypothetical protein
MHANLTSEVGIKEDCLAQVQVKKLCNQNFCQSTAAINFLQFLNSESAQVTMQFVWTSLVACPQIRCRFVSGLTRFRTH